MPSRLRSFFSAATVLAVSTALALWAADLIVAYVERPPGEAVAGKAGISWDKRDRLDVVMDARRADPNWFPAVPANTYLERPLVVDGRRIIPLGGVAEAQVVGCNESGYYSTFATDEFGFNNPRGALAAPKGKVYFLGDSYTQGDCLHKGETIVDRVRARRPETINLGSGGNGPLFQLAGIREYIRSEDASVVVWMYYEGNDLEDLRRDRGDPLLSRYLDPDFTQGLRVAQKQINDATRAMVEERMLERLRGRAVLLPNLRGLIWRLRNPPQSSQRSSRAGTAQQERAEDQLTLFLKVIAAARDEVTARGGRLVFAYLPEYYRYAGPHLSAGAARRDEVLAGVRKLDITVVDIHEAFARHADPVALFPFGVKGHYNAAGAELAAAALVEALDK